MTARAESTADRPTRASGVTGTRLPWWGLALPAAAFGALLALTVAGGGGTSAAAHPARPVTAVLAEIARMLPG
jgi:hypothetical protein